MPADTPTPQGIRSHRESQGLSQEALARQLGVSSNTVARWEQGKMQPTGLYLAIVQAWLGQDTEGGKVMATEHRHRVARREGDYPFGVCVAESRPCNPGAHGNITTVAVCACGARRSANVNGRAIEYSDWLTDNSRPDES